MALALAGLALASTGRAEDACDIQTTSRIVAVGDVHGAYDNFVKVLQMTGLVDQRLHWSGGTSRLVQTGDAVDRGTETRRVLDLLMGLEGEAQKAGGRVHALLGNHEVMNMLGDFRYVRSEEYEDFLSPRSEQLRRRLLRAAEEDARAKAKASGEAWDEAAFRARFLEQVPPGFVERREAFSPGGSYGRWLRKHDTVVRINGVVFVHGGISPEVAALGCRAINETVSRELNEDFDKTRAAPMASLAAREAGPLWYRGLAREDEQAFAPALEGILRALGARALVVGHTVSRTGRIQSRFGGRVVMIDVGMVPELGGNLAALAIDPTGQMTAVYPSGSEQLAAQAAKAVRHLERGHPLTPPGFVELTLAETAVEE